MKSPRSGNRRSALRTQVRRGSDTAGSDRHMAQAVPWWIQSWSCDTPPRRTWCGVGRALEGFVVAVFDHEACVASERFESLWEAQRAAMRLKGRYGPEAGIEKPR